MNIQHACSCLRPYGPPATPTDAAARRAQPAETAGSPAGHVTAMVSQSYVVSYFTQAYVSAAPQTAAQSGQPVPETAATEVSQPAQPAVFGANLLRFGMAVMASYAVFKLESADAAPAASAARALPGDGVDPADVDAAQRPAAELRFAAPSAGAGRVGVRPDVPPPSWSAPAASAEGMRPAAAPAPAASTAADPAPTRSAAVETPVKRLGAADFQTFRAKHLNAAAQTSFELALQTREGDRITLSFSQIDTLARTSARGRDADGDRLRLLDSTGSMQRLVNLEIDGDLSEQERVAIETLLDKVIELANAFFGGSLQAASEQMRDLNVDSSVLLDVSLHMSLTKNLQMTRAYRDDQSGFERLSERNVALSRTLDYLGQSQRELVEEARGVLEDRSAAAVVRTLLPPLLEQGLAPLRTLAGWDRDAADAAEHTRTHEDGDAGAAGSVDADRG